MNCSSFWIASSFSWRMKNCSSHFIGFSQIVWNLIFWLKPLLFGFFLLRENGLKPNPSHVLHIGLIILNPFGIMCTYKTKLPASRNVKPAMDIVIISGHLYWQNNGGNYNLLYWIASSIWIASCFSWRMSNNSFQLLALAKLFETSSFG